MTKFIWYLCCVYRQSSMLVFSTSCSLGNPIWYQSIGRLESSLKVCLSFYLQHWYYLFFLCSICLFHMLFLLALIEEGPRCRGILCTDGSKAMKIIDAMICSSQLTRPPMWSALPYMPICLTMHQKIDSFTSEWAAIQSSPLASLEEILASLEATSDSLL